MTPNVSAYSDAFFYESPGHGTNILLVRIDDKWGYAFNMTEDAAPVPAIFTWDQVVERLGAGNDFRTAAEISDRPDGPRPDVLAKIALMRFSTMMKPRRPDQPSHPLLVDQFGIAINKT